MEIEKIKIKKGMFNSWLANIIMLVVALAFIVGSSWGLIQVSERKQYYRETSAVIVEIVEITDYHEREHKLSVSYEVYVDYTINEVEYKHKKIPNYSTGMNVGDVITITYDSRKPDTPLMETNSQIALLVVCLVAGVGILVFDIVYFTKNIKKYKKRKKFIQDIMTKGFAKRVKISDIEINSSGRTFTNQKYVKITCKVAKNEYFSELFINNPKIDTQCTVNIYFYQDEYDKCVAKNERIENYYIDLKSVEKNINDL